LALSSEVWRVWCRPPPSAGGRDARNGQNVARRATSAIMEEDIDIEADERAAFQRCRSAISHRLKFCPERGQVKGLSRGERAPPARVEYLPPRRWSAGMPLCPCFGWATEIPHPYRHLHMARKKVAGALSPSLFPYCVVNHLSCSGSGDQVHHHCGTKGLSSQDLLHQEKVEGSVTVLGRTSVQRRGRGT
jgi:hypothetical protein